MSITKRWLESLPKEQQDDILGLPPGEWLEAEYETAPQIFCKPDEWYESAENEPEELDKFEERDNARLEKPRGKCVNIDGWDV
jgi:hypothetical protein